MGTIRLLLALSVVFTHSPDINGPVFVGGRNAVQLFYMISGFLISFVIEKNSNYSHPIVFYTSRALRLFPVYYVMAALSLVLLPIVYPDFLATYRATGTGTHIVLVLSNVLLLGQDWVMFLGYHSGHLVPTANFAKSDVLIYSGLLVPQAWSLGVELSFYLVAPFILKNKRLIVALLLSSIAIRVWLFHLGLALQDPWTNRFFPSELALFLLGALVQKFLLPRYKEFTVQCREKYGLQLDVLCTALLVVVIASYFLIPGSKLLKTFFLFAIFLGLLPFTFIFQAKRNWDKVIGELSYPLYIGHFLVMVVVSYLEKKFALHPIFATTVYVSASLGLAIFLDVFVARKVEVLRTRIKSSGKKAAASAPVASG